MSQHHEQIEELSQASLDDEIVLAFPLPDRIFGFHAQQAVEKILKMLILKFGLLHEFTHDITRLRATVESIDIKLPRLPFPISDLTDFAVEFRYATPRKIPTVERDQIRDSICILREHVHARLIALNA